MNDWLSFEIVKEGQEQQWFTIISREETNDCCKRRIRWGVSCRAYVKFVVIASNNYNGGYDKRYESVHRDYLT